MPPAATAGGERTTRGGLAPKAPVVRVLEHLQPWRSVELPELFRHPWPLPLEEAPLRVGHHRKMPAIRSTQSRPSLRRAVGIVRICLSRLAIGANVDEWDKLLLPDFIRNVRIRKQEPTFAMRNPNTEHRLFHTLQ